MVTGIYFFVVLCSITVLGTGAKWLSVLEDKNIKPRES